MATLTTSQLTNLADKGNTRAIAELARRAAERNTKSVL